MPPNLSHVVVVVKVTEVVTSTVDHLTDSCHSNDGAGHMILPPEVDFDDLSKPGLVRKTEVSWRPHQQCVTSLPHRGDGISDVITGNKMAAVNYKRGTVLTAL